MLVLPPPLYLNNGLFLTFCAWEKKRKFSLGHSFKKENSTQIREVHFRPPKFVDYIFWNWVRKTRYSHYVSCSRYPRMRPAYVCLLQFVTHPKSTCIQTHPQLSLPSMASKNAQNLVLPERKKELLPNVLLAVSCLWNQENIWTIQDDQESKSYSWGVAFLISICEQTLYLYFYQCDTCYWWYIVAWFRLLLHDAIKSFVDFSHPTGKTVFPFFSIIVVGPCVILYSSFETKLKHCTRNFLSMNAGSEKLNSKVARELQCEQASAYPSKNLCGEEKKAPVIIKVVFSAGSTRRFKMQYICFSMCCSFCNGAINWLMVSTKKKKPSSMLLDRKVTWAYSYLIEPHSSITHYIFKYFITKKMR